MWGCGEWGGMGCRRSVARSRSPFCFLLRMLVDLSPSEPAWAPPDVTFFSLYCCLFTSTLMCPLVSFFNQFCNCLLVFPLPPLGIGGGLFPLQRGVGGGRVGSGERGVGSFLYREGGGVGGGGVDVRLLEPDVRPVSCGGCWLILVSRSAPPWTSPDLGFFPLFFTVVCSL